MVCGKFIQRRKPYSKYLRDPEGKTRNGVLPLASIRIGINKSVIKIVKHISI